MIKKQSVVNEYSIKGFAVSITVITHFIYDLEIRMKHRATAFLGSLKISGQMEV